MYTHQKVKEDIENTTEAYQHYNYSKWSFLEIIDQETRYIPIYPYFWPYEENEIYKCFTF